MFCRSRALEHLVHRAGTDAATTTTYARRPVHRTLRRGSEVIATDAIERTAASVGDSSLRSPCCVVMRRRRTVLWLVATRALFVASRSSSCATYASTWRNTGRSGSSARSVDSDLAGPAPWCDTAGSASIQRTYRNELGLMQCEHDTTRKIVSTNCAGSAYLFVRLYVRLVLTPETSNTIIIQHAAVSLTLSCILTTHATDKILLCKSVL